MGYSFTSSRDGKCSHCGAPYKAGDEIYAKSNGVYYGYSCGCGQLAESTIETVGGALETSVLRELAKLPAEAAEGTLGQSMLYLAKQLDEGDVPPRERPQYTKELRISLLSLQDAYPPELDDDDTDNARKKRERRARENGGF